MKFYIITDRQLRELAQVIGEEARRPLLELIRNMMNDVRAVAEDMAEILKELNTVGGDGAPPIGPRD